MIKAKKVKTILFRLCLALGLSFFISVNAYAADSATYTVVSGDSLFKISQIFNTTVEVLMRDNNLKSTSLNIGQELKVPCSTYTVQKGDTLFLIAQKYKISFDALKRANNIYHDYLDIGQVLKLPILQASTLSSTSSPTIPPAVTTSSAETTYPAEDLDILSRLIHAEAQGETFDTKVAVGAVVVNRVKSGLFQSTIKGVIYQNINGYYQFTPVVNGWIDKPANEDSIKAAKTALSGTDPTNGALFYYDSSTTNQWILSKPVAAKIGSMIFAY